MHYLLEDIKRFSSNILDNVWVEPLEPDFTMNIARIPNDDLHVKISGHFDKPAQSKDHAYGDILYPFEFIMSKKLFPKIISQLETIAEIYPYEKDY
jgi:hypothetical protein